MKIDHIYIACYKYDIRLTRMLIASIRLWHPQVKISLIKDRRYGDFDTTQLEKYFGVSELEIERRVHGWGVGKLEALFIKEQHRCLILDSDIVFAGPVLNRLEKYNEDFVVQFEEPDDMDFVKNLYFDITAINREIDSSFTYPGFTFNTGQLVATTGILQRKDFDQFIAWDNPPTIKHPKIFCMAEQGILNYVLMQKLAASQITLARVPFMEVGGCGKSLDVKISELNTNSPYDFLIHWCGARGDITSPNLQGHPRSDIALYFEDHYYKRIPLGYIQRPIELRQNWLLNESKKQLKDALKLVGLSK